jgi:hypothetical protein
LQQVYSKKVEHIYVEIQNGLYRDLDLTVHCRSKNDDLGVHILKTNATYEFNFKPNFWGENTIFVTVALNCYCNSVKKNERRKKSRKERME